MKKVAIALAMMTASACGGDGGSTAPAPVINAPAITTSNTMIYVGQTVQFSATGGGTIRWGGDNNQVATVDQTTGRVVGVGNGRVTIWAENEGGRTTRLLRGLPHFGGTWRGNYVIQSCQAIGDFGVIRFCSDNFFVGQSLNLFLALTQADDRVSGTFALGSLEGNFNPGTVPENGVLALTGEYRSSDGLRITLENVRLESPSAGLIHGQLEQVWTDNELSGHARIVTRIESLTRSSGGPTLQFRSPSEQLTLDEAIRCVRSRCL